MFYIEAYRVDGSQVLGNLDGQACLRVKKYQRTNHYFNLKHGIIKVMKDIHHWKVVDASGKVLETFNNPNFKPEVTPAQKQRRKEVRIAKHEGDDVYSWALFRHNFPVYTGMSRSEASWRRDRYISDGTL